MNHIQSENKFVVEDKIRKALFRTLGDVVAVADEFNLPVDYVFKIQRKMRRESVKNPEITLAVADNITAEMISGRLERRQLLKDMVDSLCGKEQKHACSICKSEVPQTDLSKQFFTAHEYFCKTCNTVVKVQTTVNDEIYARKQALIRDLADEDDRLIRWLQKIGYAQTPPKIFVKQTNINMSDGRSVSMKEKGALNQTQSISPEDAEEILKKLEKEIFYKQHPELLPAPVEDVTPVVEENNDGQEQQQPL